MNIKLQEIIDKSIWETLYSDQFPQVFLQSYAFFEYHKKFGDEPFYLGGYDKSGMLIIGSLFVLTKARRGNYYSSAGGPIISKKYAGDKKELLENYYSQVLKYLEKRSKKDKTSFVRVRPQILKESEEVSIFSPLGFKSAPMHLYAERTWVLDISIPEEEILKNMRKKTRYAVNRAAKDGVVVRISRDPSDVVLLHKLQAQTVQKHGFVPFSLKHFQTLFNAFQEDDGVLMFVAEYEGTPVAVAMINFTRDMGVYHYAAASQDPKHLKLNAPYRILFEAIREGKRRGCRYFNFWGVVGDEDKSHPWYGLSRFKKGFGGYEEWYLHAQDYELSWRYKLIRIFETWRNKKRGL